MYLRSRVKGSYQGLAGYWSFGEEPSPAEPTALPSEPAPEPPPPPPPPPAEPLPVLPSSISTGAPAPVDYSSNGFDSGYHTSYSKHKKHLPINIWYNTPSYYDPYAYIPPPPIRYPTEPRMIVVQQPSSRSHGLPINWLTVLAVTAIVLLLRR